MRYEAIGVRARLHRRGILVFYVTIDHSSRRDRVASLCIYLDAKVALSLNKSSRPWSSVLERRQMLKLIILISITGATATAAFSEEGVWTPDDTFAQVNVFCTRVYKCGPASDIVYGGDKKLVSSSPHWSRAFARRQEAPRTVATSA